MAANLNPIFPDTAHTEWEDALATANTAQDGTGTVSTVFVATADGSWCEELIFCPLGTNIATVARVFLNNGSTNATAANNAQIAQITLPATTASNVAALFVPRLPIKMALPNGYKINVTVATTVAAGYAITAVGGDY
jgi:hypothetical protein